MATRKRHHKKHHAKKRGSRRLPPRAKNGRFKKRK